jgi:hypothetical protein
VIIETLFITQQKEITRPLKIGITGIFLKLILLGILDLIGRQISPLVLIGRFWLIAEPVDMEISVIFLQQFH